MLEKLWEIIDFWEITTNDKDKNMSGFQPVYSAVLPNIIDSIHKNSLHEM
jgi:hypothetical protein